MNDAATATSPRLFVSYSWSSPQHEQWVLQLATQLRESSVDVILDKWDLKEGNDANAFMEKMVTDPSIKKVILVCDRKYAEKANKRSGGVGTEAQIISPEIYQKQDQDKFVAVIAEKDEDDTPFLPTYYKSRVYIDLSDNEMYTKNFEQLLRWIFDKPLYVKPELGAKPVFLEETTALSLGTASRFSRAVDAIRNGRSYRNGAIQDYFATFAENLERFRISGGEEPFDDLVIQSIEGFLPFRNEAIEIFLAIAQYSNTKESHTHVHRFFESLVPYLDRPENVQTYREWDFDNFKFIIHELFLYCIAAFVKHEAFEGVSYLTNYRYYVPRHFDPVGRSMRSYEVFRSQLQSLEYRNSSRKLNRLSLHADLLQQRCVSIGVTFNQLMQADLLLFLRDCIDAMTSNSYQAWWPESLLYVANRERPFEIFARAESKEYFQSIKRCLGVEKREEYLPVFAAFKEGKLRIPSWHFRHVNVSSLMGYDSLATRP